MTSEAVGKRANFAANTVMHTELTILPLNQAGTLFQLKDGKGKTIGTGTHDVCEFLLNILKRNTDRWPTEERARVGRKDKIQRVNVRSAIVI